MFNIDDKVIVRHGTYTDGYNLSGKVGYVRKTESYVEVFIPELEKTFKMLRYEIERCSSYSFDDINELLFADQ